MSAAELVYLVFKIAATALIVFVVTTRAKDIGAPRDPLTAKEVIFQVCVDMVILAWIWWPQ